MDNSKSYYASFNGRHVSIYDYNRRLIRKYLMQADVVNAQVQGSGDNAMVAIVCKDGKSYLYSSSGRLIRK